MASQTIITYNFKMVEQIICLVLFPNLFYRTVIKILDEKLKQDQVFKFLNSERNFSNLLLNKLVRLKLLPSFTTISSVKCLIQAILE